MWVRTWSGAAPAVAWECSDVESGHAGQGVGEQGLLEGVGEAVLGVVEACAVQGLRDEANERREHGAFAGGEGVRMVVGEEEAAEGASGVDQRQEGPGLFSRRTVTARR